VGIRSPASRHTSSSDEVRLLCDRHRRCEQSIETANVTNQPCLAVERKQVVVNPEPEAHVWVHEKVQDCTTRYTSVFVDVTLSVSNLNNSTYWVYDHALNAVGCTARNVDEHVDEKRTSVLDASLINSVSCDLDAMTGQGLEPCAPRWMSAVP
jgi:hypothetical protein